MTIGPPGHKSGAVSYEITSDCINCGACEDACPVEAIREDAERGIRVVDPERCCECVGFYARVMCAAECPVESCVPDPARRETESELLARARRAFPDHEVADPPPSHFRG